MSVPAPRFFVPVAPSHVDHNRSGTWMTSPIAAPCNGEFKPQKSGALNYGFAAATNPLDKKNPHLINGSFILRPKACTDCGNFSQGFAAYAFAMVRVSTSSVCGVDRGVLCHRRDVCSSLLSRFLSLSLSLSSPPPSQPHAWTLTDPSRGWWGRNHR
jgi:hypothetical protein